VEKGNASQLEYAGNRVNRGRATWEGTRRSPVVGKNIRHCPRIKCRVREGRKAVGTVSLRENQLGNGGKGGSRTDRGTRRLVRQFPSLLESGTPRATGRYLKNPERPLWYTKQRKERAKTDWSSTETSIVRSRRIHTFVSKGGYANHI